MKWILIVLLAGMQTPDQLVAESDTEAACNHARDVIRVKFPDAKGVIECFPKGEAG
ncbi:MAG: hypothetical protein QNJ30_20090 [Kiloniellales bacterium]|nr:hypothetical protein [Kiloniellales bacterium]